MLSADFVSQGDIIPETSDGDVSGFLSGVEPINIYDRLKTLGFLLLFLLASPITLFITSITLVIHWFTLKLPVVNPNAKRILISGGGMTKALQLARSLHMAGHYIILTEEYSFTTHRFSRSVSRFCRCVDTKQNTPYIQSIVDIVKREKVDVFIPVSHSWCEAADSLVKEALLPLNCETIQDDLKNLEMLSDKSAFAERIRSLGLATPRTYKITDRKQVLEFDFAKERCQFILKSILDNNLTRWDLIKLPCQTRQQTVDYVNSLTISEAFPWVLQEFIPGKEYCTHGTLYNGEIRLYTCCKSSSWLLRYKHLDNKPLILEWVREFGSRANLTGQASFDFIESDEDGRPYAIECNPRTHTAVAAFYNHPLVAQAYLDKKPLVNGPIQPYSSACEVYWLYHEIWNLFQVRSLNDLRRSLDLLLHGKEALYSVEDPLPFLLHYTLHMPYILINNLLDPVRYKKVDCNLAMVL